MQQGLWLIVEVGEKMLSSMIKLQLDIQPIHAGQILDARLLGTAARRA